jgi:hypothetical protein
MVSKQHLFLATPAVLLLLPSKKKVRFILIAIATGLVVTLPVVLWNWHAFWHSAFEVQLKCPFRYDALSLAAAWANSGHAPPPDYLAFLAAALAACALFRAPRNAAGFAIGAAFIYLCFFAAAKQAFCNYYLMTIGVLCCAIAASGRRRTT